MPRGPRDFAIMAAVAIGGCMFEQPPKLDDPKPDAAVQGDAAGGASGVGTFPCRQTCSDDKKCTWVKDYDQPALGHLACVPDGVLAVGDGCIEATAGPMGWDQCVGGSICVMGICSEICSVNAEPSCDINYACEQKPGLFTSGTSEPIGVCIVVYDPLVE
ncbi:MAG: hypothetical protein AB7R00_28275 [Kofleriaceae bacterium]